VDQQRRVRDVPTDVLRDQPSGAIIVEGDFADVPEIAWARERVMLLTQIVFDAFYMIEDFGTLFPETSTRFLAINGQRQPTIDMRPGEVQR
jgi:hypothetical protein